MNGDTQGPQCGLCAGTRRRGRWEKDTDSVAWVHTQRQDRHREASVSSESVASTTTADRDTARLESLGYRQELSRVLGFFDNFSVAFTYLSPVVGIYSLFALGLGTGGPAYIWLMPIVVIGMLFVSLVFGELGSHYPVAGALYQYSKFTVGPSYGWWVGWFYGVALLVTVASVDTGVVSYVTTLFHNWFGTDWDPTSHSTIFIITLILLAIQTAANIVGAKVMGRIARYGTFVETFGTFGIAIILAIAGFHHGFSYLFKTRTCSTRTATRSVWTSVGTGCSARRSSRSSRTSTSSTGSSPRVTSRRRRRMPAGRCRAPCAARLCTAASRRSCLSSR